jgi:hypothetical protein
MSKGKDPTPPIADDGGSSASGTGASCCSVTLSPKNVSLCGAGKTQEVTANGSEAGGSYSFASSDAAIATVTGADKKGTITSVAQGSAQITVTFTGACGVSRKDAASVKVCTCTPKSGGGRWYAYALKNVAKLIGVRGKIKARYGKVCCEGCGTGSAYHVVYANITYGPTFKWAQTGYGKERNPGSAAIKTYRYAEMNGDVYKVNYDTSNPPSEGSTHSYACDLNKATGKWSFSFDGTVWENFADNFWKGKTGTNVQWTGEIFNKEDDMPGTAGNKCAFAECQYREDGKSYQDAGLVDADVTTDDSTEWGAEWVDGTSFNIWDKKPL